MFRSNRIVDQNAVLMEERVKTLLDQNLGMSTKMNEYIEKYKQLNAKFEAIARKRELALHESLAAMRQQEGVKVSEYQQAEERAKAAERLLHDAEERAKTAERLLQQAEERAETAERLLYEAEERAKAAEERENAMASELAAVREKLQSIEGSEIMKVTRFLETMDAIECPISDEPMTDPVCITCGHVFERGTILQWLGRNSTCPVCRHERVRVQKGNVWGEFPVNDKSVTRVLEDTLMHIKELKKSVRRTKYLWGLVRDQFTYYYMYGPKHYASDPVLFHCGLLIDKSKVGNFICLDCRQYHKDFKPLPPYLQQVWELVK